jgi:hypothetical protein
MSLTNSRGPGLSVNNLVANHSVASNTSRLRPTSFEATQYSESLSYPSSKLYRTTYSNSLSPSHISKSIHILRDYIRVKDTLNTEHRMGHLKNAVEEIEKEIEEVQRLDGGVRRNRRRTHKKVAHRNKTRARK